LESAVKERFGHTETAALGEIVVGARQFAALTKAKGHLQDALRTLEGFSQDMAGLDMENALQALEEVDGKTASDEIVSEIFSHFCVGK
jgi:tRNA modification GTPase